MRLRICKSKREPSVRIQHCTRKVTDCISHRAQVKQFVIGLFTYTNDLNKFKTHLRDFLISLKEFSGDNADLYAEEREQAVRDAQAAERTRAMKVGGLLKPSEMDHEDEL